MTPLLGERSHTLNSEKKIEIAIALLVLSLRTLRIGPLIYSSGSQSGFR